MKAHLITTLVVLLLPLAASAAERAQPAAIATLAELKQSGAEQSDYRHQQPQAAATAPVANLTEFRSRIEPILTQACGDCHDEATREGNVQIDALDPNLFRGGDVEHWLDVLSVLSKGEMPPVDEGELSDDDRTKVIDWLSAEIQLASRVRRAEREHSSFRRMTRYEYNYALQDLLGLPYDFANDLPPESISEDGFLNSSEMLHMSARQFETYRQASLAALKKATVRGEQPQALYWPVLLKQAADKSWARQERRLEKIREEHQGDPGELEQRLAEERKRFRGRRRDTHYKNLETSQSAKVEWSYNGARYAWSPVESRPEDPSVASDVVVIPPRRRLVVELGNQIPESGTLRVRVRASRGEGSPQRIPSMQIEFGWQASNDSEATVRITDRDVAIDAEPGKPQFYEWNFPISELPTRNLLRTTAEMGALPGPSEFIRLVNSSVAEGEIQVDYVEVTAPHYEQWPPESHRRIFIESPNQADEPVYAREILTSFMSRAWRRPVTQAEVDQKLALLEGIRPQCDDFQEAMLEVLATVLSSPKFLYLVQASGDVAEVSADEQPEQATTLSPTTLTPTELATRLSIFLWCSTPDEELLSLADEGQLHDPQVLASEVERLLADERSQRYSANFVRQWLGLQLLDYLDVDRKAYPKFDRSLKEAMQQEPVATFRDALQNNRSVVDFVHADHALVNERLAKHYGLQGVYGNEFRRVPLDPQQLRGGLLTQAGLLAMNSDGKDSHPLKRSIWLLERVLNDPPPPPPPAVPEIDLTDPEILKMTLKERIEDHRNQPACMSCHAKIDPWGIAFENFDAVGSWRTEVAGKPVDATSELFNGQPLDGMEGLKGFLLEHRQDQFVRAMVYKMATYALGRPLTFGDHASIDQITADVRNQGDGLATMVKLIVTSELFQTK